MPSAYRPREKDVERACDSLMAQLGWTTVRFSQPRRTMQTLGIPDRRYYHVARGVALWFECKRPGGRQRPAQRAFQTLVEACGERYVLGGADELAAAVRALADRLPELTLSPPGTPGTETRR